MKRMIFVLLCLTMMLSMTIFGVSAQEIAYPSDRQEPSDDAFDAGSAATGVTLDDPMLVPRIVVTTENGNGTQLLKSDGYVNAEVSVTDIDGSVISDACSIKVRGNTTAFDSVPKKAFAFKFAKKKNLLGMGSGKKWVLLANCYDPTLLRNYLAIDMAQTLGLDYTSRQRFVELWLDGSYRGCYTLYTPIQEGTDRVDIDIKSNNGKKDFLIELEVDAVEENTSYFTIESKNRLRFACKDPDDLTDEQLDYISGVMNDIVDVLKTGDREQIGQVIDIPSFEKVYLVNEFMKNMDFDATSVYFYYKDGKLYSGPVWDFDKSSGNTDPTIHATRALNTYKTDGIMHDQNNLYIFLGRLPWFVDGVKQLYEEYYDYFENIFADGGTLDSWREEYGELFDRNFTVFDIKRKWTTYQYTPKPTYEENYQYFKNWCSERNSWLHDHWDLFAYEYLRGDADGNGSVEVFDVTVIQRMLTGLKINDPDGYAALRAAAIREVPSITDATVLQRYLAMMGNPYDLDVKVKTNLR